MISPSLVSVKSKFDTIVIEMYLDVMTILHFLGILFNSSSERKLKTKFSNKMLNNSEARKRPFPFPALLSNDKRERRSSQSSETSGCSSVTNAEDSSKLKCRLCDNKVCFKNSEDFDFHLTMIHYRDKLLDVLGDPPYSCRHCGFSPTADDPNEEMILHYGCKERFSIKYYVEECQNLTRSSEHSEIFFTNKL